MNPASFLKKLFYVEKLFETLSSESQRRCVSEEVRTRLMNLIKETLPGLRNKVNWGVRSMLLAVLCCILAGSAYASEHCDFHSQIERTLRAPLNPTERLQTLLAQMLEQKILSMEEFIAWKEALKNGRLVNPIPERRGAIDSIALVYRQSVEKIILEVSSPHSFPVLLEWANIRIAKETQIHQEREQVKTDTTQTFYLNQLLPIPPGQLFSSSMVYFDVPSFFTGSKTLVNSKLFWAISSFGSTQPVGRLAPYRIGNGEFFDLHGNINIWIQDLYDPHPGRREGIGDARVARGGSWSSSSHYLKSESRIGLIPGRPTEFAGARLVRTIR